MLTGTGDESPAEVLTLDILSRRGKTIRPKTLNQKRYVDAIDAHTIVFGIGPAGTGKTYLAMAKAVNALQTKQVNRIILTRPAVEAGERLGFLPGTLYEKIDPYLRPLYDALHDMMDPELIPKLMSAGVIEVAPLAFMRGRAQPLSTEVLTPERFPGDWGPSGWRFCHRFRRTSNGSLGRLPAGLQGDLSGSTPRTDHRRSRQVTTFGRYIPTRDRRRGKPARVLETKEMIGNLRAAHQHRYELPLLSSPVEFRLPTGPDSIRMPLASYSATDASRAGPHRGSPQPILSSLKPLGALFQASNCDENQTSTTCSNRITTSRRGHHDREPSHRRHASTGARWGEVRHQVRTQGLPLQFA